MPQMMPINWIFSFIFFISIFIIFNIMNYFILMMKYYFYNNNNKKLMKNNFTWKW
uniref:ATP synthase complex subunit 8 n=1 Tax=Athyma cama TaxID=1417363 RepID=A0A067YDN5_9NEOP|nr:ATP synthase F0 subunit 8 [Athyma cama]AHA03549.1 ATP synthase F0 subunit 8 [Athyma cama]